MNGRAEGRTIGKGRERVEPRGSRVEEPLWAARLGLEYWVEKPQDWKGKLRRLHRRLQLRLYQWGEEARQSGGGRQ